MEKSKGFKCDNCGVQIEHLIRKCRGYMVENWLFYKNGEDVYENAQYMDTKYRTKYPEKFESDGSDAVHYCGHCKALLGDELQEKIECELFY